MNARIRKTERGLRLSGHLTIPASLELERIREEYGNRSYDILSTAVVHYAKFLRGELPMQYKQPPRAIVAATPGHKKPQSATAVALDTAKAIWCEECGGTVEGNLCSFDKYEVTMTGVPVTGRRTLALADMPNEKSEFTKMIIGPYANVYEARKAVEESKRKEGA